MKDKKATRRRWSKEFTNSELLKMLKDEIIRVGLEENPSRTELQKRFDSSRIPHPNTYTHKFGKWENIMRVLDLNYSGDKSIMRGASNANSGKRHASTWSNMTQEEVVEVVLNKIAKEDIRTAREYMENTGEDAPSLPTLKYLFGLKWSDVKGIYEKKYNKRIDGQVNATWMNYTDEELLDKTVEEMHRLKTTRVSDFKEKRDRSKAPAKETLGNRGYSWKNIKEYYYKKYGEENKND